MARAKEETRSTSARLRFLAVVAALAPAPAAAGVWVAPEGGQSITTSAVGERENGGYYYEGSIYFEAPVRAESSLVVARWFETDPSQSDGDRIEATFSAKHAINRSDNEVIAVQAGALWVSDPSESCSEGGAKLRVLGGRSFSGGRGFFNAEGAERALSGGCEGSRIDSTAGYRPAENWLAMGQVFVDFPVEGDDSIKAQVTIVRFDHRGHGWQIGLRARIDGEHAEPVIVVGLWGRPRDSSHAEWTFDRVGHTSAKLGV